jgi:hypothetical protein
MFFSADALDDERATFLLDFLAMALSVGCAEFGLRLAKCASASTVSHHVQLSGRCDNGTASA